MDPVAAAALVPGLSALPAPTTLLLALAVALVLSRVLFSVVPPRRHLPPGPRPLPVLGNLHQLGTPPWFKLAELAKTHGDIMSVRLGALPAVVLSSPAAIRAFHLDHGRFFLSRPSLYIFSKVSRNNRTGIIATNGDVWKHARKIALQLMLTKTKFAYYEAVTAAETRDVLLKDLLGIPGAPAAAANTAAAATAAPVRAVVVNDVRERLHLLLASVLMRICVGRAFDTAADPKLAQTIRAVDEFMKLGAEGYLGDFFPIVNWLPSSFRARTEAMVGTGQRVMGAFVSKAKADRAQGKELEACMLAQLLDVADQEGLTDDNMAQILIELVGGGMDTTATTLEWVLIALANFPDVQERLRQEIADVLDGRLYTGEDAARLPYLNAVIYETMRWVVLVPFPLPRVASEDVDVRGYVIPKGTAVFMNMYACSKDPRAWPEPETFRPERFLEKDYDVVSCHNPDFAPFSIGPRQCPGARLSAMNMAVILTMLLQHYRLKRPTDALLSTEVTPGLVAVPKQAPTIVFERL